MATKKKRTKKRKQPTNQVTPPPEHEIWGTIDIDDKGRPIYGVIGRAGALFRDRRCTNNTSLWSDGSTNPGPKTSALREIGTGGMTGPGVAVEQLSSRGKWDPIA